MLTDIALSHYTTKISRCSNESRLAIIASITKGARIVISKTRICATTQPRKAVKPMRKRLKELISQVQYMGGLEGKLADHLLANGVIVLPCKVGDKVYKLDDIVWHSECCDCEHYHVGGFGDPSECGRTRLGGKHPDCIKIKEEVVTQHDIFYYLYEESFGKTVFLTREEAEKALKEVKR